MLGVTGMRVAVPGGSHASAVARGYDRRASRRVQSETPAGWRRRARPAGKPLFPAGNRITTGIKCRYGSNQNIEWRFSSFSATRCRRDRLGQIIPDVGIKVGGNSLVRTKASTISETARNCSRARGGRVHWSRCSGYGARTVTQYRLDHTQWFAQGLWTFCKDVKPHAGSSPAWRAYPC
jgi:hypothetical protein